jgi:hypothetical protein
MAQDAQDAHKTATTRLAAQALVDLKKLERMRANGVLDQYLHELRPQQPKKFNKLFLLLLLLPLLFLPFLGGTSHQVSGILRDEKSALGDARIAFHGAHDVHAISDNAGKFVVKGLAAGDYKITVGHEKIDVVYHNTATTPLKINVTKTIKNLNVAVRRALSVAAKR